MTISASTAHATSILQAFAIEPAPADIIVKAYFKRHREMHSRLRREVADLVFGVLRWRRRLEASLREAGIARPTHAQLADHYATSPPEDHDREDGPGEPAVHFSYPDFLYRMFVDDYGEGDARRIMAALNHSAPLAVRVNTLKATRAQVIDMLAREGLAVERTRSSPYGLVFPKRVDLNALDAFNGGLIDVQDEASQLAAMAVRARPGEIILDACAGGGGKSLAMAMFMENRGTLIALDPVQGKLRQLRGRARRAGATCIQAHAPDRAPERYRGSCDAVVIDAPCSGTGTIKRSPDIKWRLEPGDIEARASTQRALLDEYASWLKPGGRLVYMTCSVLKRENERIVEGFLAGGSYEPMPAGWLKEAGIDARFITTEGYFSSVPALAAMDGFFVGIIKKSR